MPPSPRLPQPRHLLDNPSEEDHSNANPTQSDDHDLPREEESTQTEGWSHEAALAWQCQLDQAEEQEVNNGQEGGAALSVMQVLTEKVGKLFQQDRCDRGTQTLKDPLMAETERLAQDVVFFVVGRRPPQDGGKSGISSSQHHDLTDVSECLRRTVTKMLEKHSLVFNSMVSRLRVDGESDLELGFRGLCGELFCQGEVSWSKIVALFAFGARLAQHCQENHLQGMVVDVVEHLASFAVENLTPFLRDNGGWATLCEAFPADSDYESTIWKTLVLTGVGLTAAATFLALQKR